MTTVAMIGRDEANLGVAGVGFGCGAIGAVLFDAWAGWRGVLWTGEVVAFGFVLLIGPLWLSYSVRTIPDGAEEAERARKEEPW